MTKATINITTNLESLEGYKNGVCLNKFKKQSNFTLENQPAISKDNKGGRTYVASTGAWLVDAGNSY